MNGCIPIYVASLLAGQDPQNSQNSFNSAEIIDIFDELRNGYLDRQIAGREDNDGDLYHLKTTDVARWWWERMDIELSERLFEITERWEASLESSEDVEEKREQFAKELEDLRQEINEISYNARAWPEQLNYVWQELEQLREQLDNPDDDSDNAAPDNDYYGVTDKKEETPSNEGLAEEQLRDQQGKDNVSPKQLRTLYAMIRGLAKEAKIDLETHYKTADIIASLIGPDSPIPDTIARQLKKITKSDF